MYHFLLIPYSLYLLFGILFLVDNNPFANCYIFEYVTTAMCIQTIIVAMLFKKCIATQKHYFMVLVCGLILTIWGALETSSISCVPFNDTTLFGFSQATTVLQGILYVGAISSFVCDLFIHRPEYNDLSNV